MIFKALDMHTDVFDTFSQWVCSWFYQLLSDVKEVEKTWSKVTDNGGCSQL